MKRLIPLIAALVCLVLIFALGRTPNEISFKAAACYITAALYAISYQQQWAGKFYRYDILPGVIWFLNGLFQTFILASVKAYS